ncbi:MAG: hypothetical protein M1474_02635 [Candidatus Marsarchaeota archaeon]|nr:hypothetical protein [Candidatus Marsarchaeota archaeon]
MRRLWSRDLKNIVAAIRSGEFKYGEKEKATMGRNKCYEAQADEIAGMMQMINNIADTAFERTMSRAPDKKRLPGRPRMPADDIAKIMLFQCCLSRPRLRVSSANRSE